LNKFKEIPPSLFLFRQITGEFLSRKIIFCRDRLTKENGCGKIGRVLCKLKRRILLIKRLLEYLSPYKKRIVVILLISACFSALTLSNAWLLGQLTDAIFYRTKGLPLSVTLNQPQNQILTLNFVKNSSWTAKEQRDLDRAVKSFGLTILTDQSEGPSVYVRVSSPQQLASDPLRLLSGLKADLRPKLGQLQAFISAEESKKSNEIRILPQFYTIFIIPFVIMLLYLLRGIFGYAQGYMVGAIGQKIIMRLRNQIYQNLQNLSISYFERNKTGQTGQLISRITNDIDAINFLFTSGIFDMILQPMVVIIGLIYGFILNWQLTLMFFLVFPFIAFPIDRLTRKLRDINTEIMNKLADITDILEETFSGIKVVKAFGMERYEIERFERETQANYKATMRGLIVSKTVLPIIEFTISIGLAIFLTYSGSLILHSALSPSQFFTFILLMTIISDPIRSLSGVYSSIPRTIVAAERVFELIDQKSEVVEAASPVKINTIQGKVEFAKVTFGYTAENIVLKKVDLAVKPGEVIALVGPSGAGKTTMVNLVARFYDPLTGVIKIDDHDLRQIKLDSLRQAMGIVPQETVLFRGTIAENIAYGKTNASMEEIIAAAKASNAQEFIEQMPEGYQTKVGSRGTRLSGGQRQRIAIARALLRDPRILILDEATSALDTQSEILVQEALQRLMKNRTCFVIAHRLSTIRSADRIVVMQEGQIAEIGTHDELLMKNGLYALLYRTQFREQEVDSNLNG
jgi:ATP-binding cassette, subfamily B, bacterial MsbA